MHDEEKKSNESQTTKKLDEVFGGTSMEQCRSCGRYFNSYVLKDGKCPSCRKRG